MITSTLMTIVTFRDLLRTITPSNSMVVLLMMLILASNIVSLASPWFAGQITASLLQPLDAHPVIFLLPLWLLVFLGTNLLNFFVNYQSTLQGELMCSILRSKLHKHMQDLPVSHFYEKSPGDTLTYFTNDIENIGYFVTDSVLPVLPMLILLGITFVLMANTSPIIAIATIALLPGYSIAVKLVARKLRGITRDWIEAYVELVNQLEQRLGNMMLIKLFSEKDTELAKFDTKNKAYVSLSRKQHLFQSAIAPISSSLAALGLILVLWLGYIEINAGKMTPAELVMLVLYANLMRSPITSLASLYGHYQVTRGAAERLLDMFNTSTESDDGAPITDDDIRISLRNLSFRYDAPLLEDINAEIDAGDVVALSGRNGSGKTTLAYLMMSLIKANRGQLFINGVDISELSPSSLRANASFVSQNTLLLNDTIINNISFTEHADRGAAEAAARAVQADQFIQTLPQGYDTVVGDQGLKLSGGQRQKIALARAMFKDAPFLILDEPTSMFDIEAEADFIEGCKTLFTGRTVVIISHSDRMLSLANRHLILQDHALTEASTRNAIV